MMMNPPRTQLIPVPTNANSLPVFAVRFWLAFRSAHQAHQGSSQRDQAAARKEPVLAAEGAIVLLGKLSPALEQVDSSSGALGSNVNKAIEGLVPLIAKADILSTLVVSTRFGYKAEWQRRI